MKLALDHYFLKLRQNLAKSIACCCWPGGKRYLCEKMQVCLKMLKICSCSISFSDSFSHTTTCLLACEFVVSPAKHYNNKHNNYAFPSNCHCSKKSNKLWERGHISLFGISYLLWPTGINWGITGFWFGKITFKLLQEKVSSFNEKMYLCSLWKTLKLFDVMFKDVNSVLNAYPFK